jgi:NitT/TauT family transport system substrate-binding protein
MIFDWRTRRRAAIRAADKTEPPAWRNHAMTLSLTRRNALIGLAAAGTLPLIGRPACAATPVNLGVIRLASQAPTFIAQERGYFDKEGLAVTLKFFEAAEPLAVAIAARSTDYGVTAMSGGLISLSEKGAVKVIGGALQEEKGLVGAIILASNKAYDAGLTTPAKLAGHSFGITTTGSSFHYMAYKIAEANKIPMSAITLRPLQKVGAVVGALTSGQIDAWAIQPNIAKKMLAQGAAKQIGIVSDYAPDYQVTTVFSSTANATEERAKTEAFLRAYSRAVDDYNAAVVDKTADKQEVEAIARIVHKYVDVDSPFDQAFANFTDGAMRINKGLAMSLGSLKDQLAWFKAEKMVKDTITPEMLFDTSYVKVI